MLKWPTSFAGSGQRRESKPNGVAEQTAASGSGGELIKVDPSRVSTERHREAGPVHVGYQFWQRLELDGILCDCGLSETVCQLSCDDPQSTDRALL
jgi:hypothetical protein